MHSPWLVSVQELARRAAHEATAAAGKFQTFGQIISCVDARCFPVWEANLFKHLRMLGADANDRNGSALVERLHHDALRAERLGLRQLVICETHADCAYRQRHGLSEQQVWENFRRWCGRLPNTSIAWCSRELPGQALAVCGTRHRVSASQLQPVANDQVGPVIARYSVRVAGYTDDSVTHDLAQLLLGNARYQQRAAPLPNPCGVVIGSGIPGAPTHYSVSNRVEANLQEALQIALGAIRTQVSDPPEIMLAVARHPARRHRQAEYLDALRRLKGVVGHALAEIGEFGRCTVHTVFAEKGSGELNVVRI